MGMYRRIDKFVKFLIYIFAIVFSTSNILQTKFDRNQQYDYFYLTVKFHLKICVVLLAKLLDKPGVLPLQVFKCVACDVHLPDQGLLVLFQGHGLPLQTSALLLELFDDLMIEPKYNVSESSGMDPFMRGRGPRGASSTESRRLFE